METLLHGGSLVLVLLIGLCLIRVVGGPTVLDRIAGATMVGTMVTVLLLMIGVQSGQVAMFVDIALAYALLNFIATLGAAKYFLHRTRAGQRKDD